MKKVFRIAISENGKITSYKEVTGTADENAGVFFHDGEGGKVICSDIYTGIKFTEGNTKKECQEALKKIMKKINNLRNGKDYIRLAINYLDAART